MTADSPFDALDSYELSHLPAHLAEAGEIEILFRLLAWEDAQGDNAWNLIKQVTDPSDAAFVTDVATAWDVAERFNAQAAASGRGLPFLGREIWCALVTASVRSYAEHLPLTLLTGLVRDGLWMPEHAVAAVFSNPDVTEFPEAVAALWPLLGETARSELLQRGLSAARDHPVPLSRVMLYVGVIARLPQAQRAAALAEAQAVADELARTSPVGSALGYEARDAQVALFPLRTPEDRQPAFAELMVGVGQDASARAEAIRQVSPSLPAELVPEVLEIVRSFASFPTQEPHPEGRALAALAAHVPEAFLGDVQAMARELPEAGFEQSPRGMVLTRLASRLPEAEREPVLAEALRAVDRLWGRGRSEALVDLAPLLSATAAAEVSAWLGHDSADRATGAAALIPRLADPRRSELIDEVYRALRSNEPIHNQFEPLLRLAWATTGDQRAEAAAMALATARTLPQGAAAENTGRRRTERADALARVAELLPSSQRPDILREALAATRGLGDGQARGAALAALAPWLPDKSIEHAWRVAAELPSTGTLAALDNLDGRHAALVGVAARLPAALTSRALHSAADSTDEEARSRLVCAISGQLPQSEVAGAVDFARGLENPVLRGRALARLSARLDALEQHALMREAILGAPVTMTAPRADALAVVLPHLHGSEADAVTNRIMAGLGEIAAPARHAQVVAALLPRLNPHARSMMLREALALVTSTADAKGMASALAWLGPHLVPPFTAQALGAAREVTDARWRSAALTGLLPCRDIHLDVAREAVAAAYAIDDRRLRAEALSDLSAHMDDEERARLLRMAYEAANQVSHPMRRARARTHVASRTDDPGGRYQLAVQALDDIADATDYAARLGIMATLAALLDEETGRELREAVLTSAPSSALPGLLQHSYLLTPWQAAQILRPLAPALTPTELSEVEELAHALPEAGPARRSPRASALAALAPRLDGPRRVRAIEAAVDAAATIDDDLRRTELLVQLAASADEPQCRQILTAATHAPSLKELWHRTPAYTDPGKYAEVLIAAALDLPSDLALQAVPLAGCIPDAELRAELLAALLPHVPSGVGDDIVRETLQGLAHPDFESFAARAIAQLAPVLPKHLLPQALTIAQALPEPGEALAALAGGLPEPERRITIEQVGDLARNAEWRGPTFIAALAASCQDTAVVSLIAEALSQARSLTYPGARAGGLAKLLPYVPVGAQEGVIDEIISVAPTLDTLYRSDVLANVVPVLTAMPGPAIHRLLRAILRPAAARDRQQVLWELRGLARALADLSSPGGPAEALEAIDAIGRWWP